MKDHAKASFAAKLRLSALGQDLLQVDPDPIALFLPSSTYSRAKYPPKHQWTYENYYNNPSTSLKPPRRMAGSPNSNLRGFNHAVQTLLRQPAQFLPHLTIPTFTHLPEELGPHLVGTVPRPSSIDTPEKTTPPPAPQRIPTIRALVLDKDNTLCPPKTTTFPPQILSKLHALRTSPTSPFHLARNPHSILIVSNRAGSHPSFDREVRELEAQLAHLQISVFRLPAGVEKKPFCGEEVVRWFQEKQVIQSPNEIAVVGDRLGTDVIMAGMMGSWSVWCNEGVFEPGMEGKPGRNVLEKMEVWIERYLRVRKGYTAPAPRGWEE